MGIHPVYDEKKFMLSTCKASFITKVHVQTPRPNGEFSTLCLPDVAKHGVNGAFPHNVITSSMALKGKHLHATFRSLFITNKTTYKYI